MENKYFKDTERNGKIKHLELFDSWRTPSAEEHQGFYAFKTSRIAAKWAFVGIVLSLL